MWSARTWTPEKAVYHNCLKEMPRYSVDAGFRLHAGPLPLRKSWIAIPSPTSGTADSIQCASLKNIGYDRNVILAARRLCEKAQPAASPPPDPSLGKIRLSSMPSRTATSATTRPRSSGARDALETSWSSAPEAPSQHWRQVERHPEELERVYQVEGKRGKTVEEVKK